MTTRILIRRIELEYSIHTLCALCHIIEKKAMHIFRIGRIFIQIFIAIIQSHRKASFNHQFACILRINHKMNSR